MAKKKSASSATPAAPKSANPAKPEKAANPAATKKTPSSKADTNGAASSAITELGHHQIGATAGAVWGLLSEKGDTTLAALKKEIDAPAELVLAAVGWLAREEKLEFCASGKNTKLTLK